MHSSCQFKKEARPVPALSPIRAGHRLAKSYGACSSPSHQLHTFPPYLVVRMPVSSLLKHMAKQKRYEMAPEL